MSQAEIQALTEICKDLNFSKVSDYNALKKTLGVKTDAAMVNLLNTFRFFGFLKVYPTPKQEG